MPTVIGDCPVFIQIKGPSEITRATKIWPTSKPASFDRKTLLPMMLTVGNVRRGRAHCQQVDSEALHRQWTRTATTPLPSSRLRRGDLSAIVDSEVLKKCELDAHRRRTPVNSGSRPPSSPLQKKNQGNDAFTELHCRCQTSTGTEPPVRKRTWYGIAPS
ncbi:hypothetical protein K505DRAFT_356404 [Melanomma pulvis-pyrius CBS 109.77]|uniref:Uncharacterized protein n=1 Tax=Melanomma pulvis-pyrius CBS 109.77 TaxID=1314802 RepID=A0A6A6XVW0_9PLEO|nr:hypothetical protein K505DRAFT_356404 [Melanomma pulvis-pyrius CBS 109.77]